MSKVYRVASIYGIEYCNTAREADRCKPGGESPESVTCVDAAGECNRMEREYQQLEQMYDKVRYMLEELRDVCCPVEAMFKTEIGRQVQSFIKENPLPPATDANRDGQRSYGV